MKEYKTTTIWTEQALSRQIDTTVPDGEGWELVAQSQHAVAFPALHGGSYIRETIVWTWAREKQEAAK